MPLEPSAEAFRILRDFDRPTEYPELLTKLRTSVEVLPAFPEIAWRGAAVMLGRRSQCTRVNGSSATSTCRFLVRLETKRRQRNRESSTVDSRLREDTVLRYHQELTGLIERTQRRIAEPAGGS